MQLGDADPEPPPPERGTLAWAVALAMGPEDELWRHASEFCWVASNHLQEEQLAAGCDRLADRAVLAEREDSDQVLTRVVGVLIARRDQVRLAALRSRAASLPAGASSRLPRSLRLLGRPR